MKRKLILASASPRRRELLQQIGLEFEVLTSDAPEITSETGRRNRKDLPPESDGGQRTVGENEIPPRRGQKKHLILSGPIP